MSAVRPIISPFNVILNGDMAGNITSQVSIIQNISMIGYDISWTGSSPVGVMSVQVSNTYSTHSDGSVKNAGTWSTLPLSATPTVSGSTGNGFIDCEATGAYAMRLVYTRTSGTGTMQAVLSAKVA